MRHGADPDHLAAIDGLTRIRPRATNGVFFALGHGLVVVLLAVGIGHLIAARFAFVGPWVLILIGAINLLRLVQTQTTAVQPSKPIVAQPLLLGMLLAAGFETSSQLSALILAGQTNAWVLGAVFSGGMILVDGIDGLLAAKMQRLATLGQKRAVAASRLLGALVVTFAFGLGGAELVGFDLGRLALPVGLALFATVLAIRIWSRFNPIPDSKVVTVPRQAHS
jgi:high-affinity nickel-transport protein